jgi:hypothetical protein
VTGHVEDALESGLASLIARLPAAWWQEQRAFRESLGEEYLCEPLMLSGGVPAKMRPNRVHRYAYALMLAEDSLNKRNGYDIYEGAVLVPMVAAIARLQEGLAEVNGGLDRLDALPRAPSREVESRLYELAVAARSALLGRKVEFLDAVTAITPDLRIHDLGFPAVVECKLQRRLSEYEEQEFMLVQHVFRRLSMPQRQRGLVGELRITAREPLTSIGADVLVSTAERCTGGLNPYGSIEEPWGSIAFAPMPVTIDLPAVTRLYSPDFLSWVFGWNFETTDDDGICAVVENNREIMVGRAALPFCLKWRTEHEKILDRKARSLASLLSESIRQIPVGEAGFVYLGYEETHRDTVADRRTRRFLDLVGKWEVRKRGVNLQLIVVNRLYPAALYEGRPNLVESAMPTSPHDENVWGGKLPSAVFVDGSRAQTLAPA